MFESSTSQGLVKRPATSTTQEKRGRKRGAEDEEEARINLTVKGQDKEVQFDVKRTTKLQKILKKFCEKARVEYRTMRFLYDGSRFKLTGTPDELHMSDGDEIDAMVHCGGGGNAAVV